MTKVIGMLISLNLIDWLVQPLKCITYTCIQVNCGQNPWLLHDASLDINVSLVLLNQHDQRSNWYGHIVNRPIMMGTTFQRYHLHLHPSKLWPELFATWRSWCIFGYQTFLWPFWIRMTKEVIGKLISLGDWLVQHLKSFYLSPTPASK